MSRLWGSPYCPEFGGRLVFLDCHHISPDELYAYLVSFQDRGAFSGVAGLVISRISRPRFGTASEFAKVIDGIFASSTFPVAAEVDFGHTEPMLSLRDGALCTLDTSTGQVRLELSPEESDLAHDSPADFGNLQRSMQSTRKADPALRQHRARSAASQHMVIASDALWS